MKKPVQILTFILILGFNSVFAQKTDTMNVYFQALKLHIDYLNNLNYQRPLYYIEQNDYTTDNLPKTINGNEIEILKSKALFEKTKNKDIQLIAIRPARWRNNRLVIYIIDFGVSRKRKQYFYLNGGGSSFEIIGKKNGALGLKVINQGGI